MHLPHLSGYEWISAILTVGLLIVAGVQAGIYFIQAKLMRQTIERSDIASQRELRAYLGISEAEYDDKFKQVWFYLKNYGQSPAIDVVAYTSTRAVINGPQIDTHSFGLITPSSQSRGFYALHDPDYTAIAKNTDSVRVKFTIEYSDVFGHRWRQTVDFTPIRKTEDIHPIPMLASDGREEQI